ncbi:IS1595 family transposase [Natrinema sp. CBA1119]|uniref:IS1595 family transposase n=1 Tax=Natrinema sp. CBA1119 TaxID=1608465 RepID=UPI000BF29C04|nr:IS1595 family transposase [Natrinema sp. CBA1119]PGF14343.1 IS1595 family transposase [Natrinema sp. CBA1119]PGF14353.1 IS1595 family transposase [Natrinema sp. CBA1119]
MSSAQPAFGAMFRELIELGVVEIDTEPLDARIERRLKEFWENTSCPRCGHTSVQTWPHLDRVWCRDCNFKPVYTYGTPFHEKHLTCGEVLLAFTFYADTLLSINQIAPLLGRAYKTVHTAIREVEAVIHRGFPVVWDLLDQTIDGPTQVDESGTVCSGYKGQEPPRSSRSRGGSSQTGRSRWRGRHGDQLTLVAACRDSLRVIRGKFGIDFSGDLEPVIQEAEDLSQPLGEVWTDGLQAYREMERDHRTVVHKERYVSPDGVHINQAECLFSLVQPWLRKFRGLSKQGLGQAAHTFGIVRSLNLAGESVDSTIDCIVIGAFRSST